MALGDKLFKQAASNTITNPSKLLGRGSGAGTSGDKIKVSPMINGKQRKTLSEDNLANSDKVPAKKVEIHGYKPETNESNTGKVKQYSSMNLTTSGPSKPAA